MESLATQAVARRQIRRGIDPETLARLIVASFTGVQMVSNVRTGRQDVMDRIKEMWEILLPGIIDQPSGAEIRRLTALVTQE